MATYLLNTNKLNNIYSDANNNLFKAPRIKFERVKGWNKQFSNCAGIYALFDGNGKNKEGLLYIGESGKLLERMKEIHRTVNHSFRVQLGKKRFNGVREKPKGKFVDSVEGLLDEFYDTKLYVAFLPVNFGRIEIETYLIDANKDNLLNSIKKRK